MVDIKRIWLASIATIAFIATIASIISIVPILTKQIKFNII